MYKDWSGGGASEKSGDAMVLRKLSVPGSSTDLDNSRARAYCAYSGAGGGCLDIFVLACVSFLFFSPSLWETA